MKGFGHFHTRRALALVIHAMGEVYVYLLRLEIS